ncbi:MAG: hypothetical protein Q2306_00565 [Phytoplasma sp.]|nr:hypothetical protein [Phytoplasma sp.]WRH06823.1 MAG: hypothetical protein Q2306_00565 [Phytoplasma sp.]
MYEAKKITQEQKEKIKETLDKNKNTIKEIKIKSKMYLEISIS